MILHKYFTAAKEIQLLWVWLAHAPGIRQGSEKWGRWGRIFLDKAKSHGQFGPKTTCKTDRQKNRHFDTDRQSEDRQKDTQTD